MCQWHVIANAAVKDRRYGFGFCFAIASALR
jgi:hypothetical protein